MPRARRISYPGAYYHAIARCNNQEFLFKGDEDFNRYLMFLRHYKDKFKFKLLHFCLLNNHVHLCLQLGAEAGISRIIQRINSEYAGWYNQCRRRKGHFWQGRFKSFLIEDERYLMQCGIYIEMNVVRAGIVDHPLKWHYCSSKVYLDDVKKDLVDISPAYLSLSDDPQRRKALYNELISTELMRTAQIREALSKQDKKELLRILEDYQRGPVPFYKHVFRLFPRRPKFAKGV